MQHVRNAQRVAKVAQERELNPPVPPGGTFPGASGAPARGEKPLQNQGLAREGEGEEEGDEEPK